MAKSKKRKRPAVPRARVAPTITASGRGDPEVEEAEPPNGAAGTEAPPTGAPGAPSGPNRKARKEEARRQRERLRRKMARRRFLRIVGMVTAAVVVVAAVSIYLVTRPNPAKAAGCETVLTIPPYKKAPANDRAHISPQGPVTTPPPLSTYSSFPPVSGPHDPTPLRAGVYRTPPNIYQAIHSLEHAAVIIWYAPGVSGAALTALQDFYRSSLNNDHVIVAPFDYRAGGSVGKLPAGKQMVLVAWHHIERCARVSLAAAKAFVAGYRYDPANPNVYKGDAPETGSPI